MGRKRDQVNEVQQANKITIEPKTKNQKKLLDNLRSYDQNFAVGPAGTGKTFVATIEACRLFLLGKVEKIVITRPAVAAGGEEYGFLPGGINQKMGPWVQPVMELLEEALGKQKVQDHLKSGVIEIAPLGFMRGRTFRNSFVILDEAQNTTREQMELILTRLGEGSQIVISGDLRQSDIGKVSGLSEAIRLLKKHKIPAGLIEFDNGDVVRSELCKRWVEAFTP